jgi:hypothetical protein
MDSGKPKIKELSEGRFDSIIFFLRLGGISFKMRNLSTVYATYMTIVIISTCTTFVGLFADLYVHWDDLGRTMTNMRVLFPATDALWLYTSCRYVRTLTVIVTVSRFA